MLARSTERSCRLPSRGTSSVTARIPGVILHPTSGAARAGKLLLIVIVERPQVVDLRAWNLANPREGFWASSTRQLHQSHVTTVDRLWSWLPYLRPILTITRDTIQYPVRSRRGRRRLPACSARAAARACTSCSTARSSTSGATSTWFAWSPVSPHRVDVHDVLNVFQVTGSLPTVATLSSEPGESGGRGRSVRALGVPHGEPPTIAAATGLHRSGGHLIERASRFVAPYPGRDAAQPQASHP
jgi:Domain of unknown function (DUF1989)